MEYSAKISSSSKMSAHEYASSNRSSFLLFVANFPELSAQLLIAPDFV